MHGLMRHVVPAEVQLSTAPSCSEGEGSRGDSQECTTESEGMCPLKMQQYECPEWRSSTHTSYNHATGLTCKICITCGHRCSLMEPKVCFYGLLLRPGLLFNLKGFSTVITKSHDKASAPNNSSGFLHC